MLILAGVSINAIIGDNGILSRTQYSVFLSEMTAVEEAVQIWKVANNIENLDDSTLPTKGVVTTDVLYEHDRLYGEIAYYRRWQETDTMPTISVKLDVDTFNNEFDGDLYGIGNKVLDLYYLDLDKIDYKSKYNYLIDITNGMIYQLEGKTIFDIKNAHSLAMYNALNGMTDKPIFAETMETDGPAGGTALASVYKETSKYLMDEQGNYIDKSGNVVDSSNKVENEKYNPDAFRIYGDYSNNNIYKLYNNGDLYGKGEKGLLLNTSPTEMAKIDSTKWTALTIPSEIPGANDGTAKLVQGSDLMFVIDKNGEAWAWGNNGSTNRLGLSEEEQIEYTGATAIKLTVGEDGEKVYKIIPTSDATYIVMKKGENYNLYASGNNLHGELGIGDNIMTNTDKFFKVDFENPQYIKEITLSGSAYSYRLILTEEEKNVHRIYVAGSTKYLSGCFSEEKTLTTFTEILNGTNGNKIGMDVKDIYVWGMSWGGAGCEDFLFMCSNTGDGVTTKKIYRFKNGTASEYKLDNFDANYENYYINTYGTWVIQKKNASGQSRLWAYNANYSDALGYGTAESFKWVDVTDVWKELDKTKIKDIMTTNSNIFVLTTDNQVYAVGDYKNMGVGKASGSGRQFLTSNDLNNKTVESFVKTDNQVLSAGTMLIKCTDGTLLTTGNSLIAFRENIFQKNWTRIAQNVKKFSAQTVDNSLAYIDFDDDVWVLGNDAKYFGITSITGVINNFVRLKDNISNNATKTAISNKVSSAYCMSNAFFLLTNDSSKSLYSVGTYQASVYPSWPVYSYTGFTTDKNELTVLQTGVKNFFGDRVHRFFITTDNKFYSFGNSDGNFGSYQGISPVERTVDGIEVSKIKSMTMGSGNRYIIALGDTKGSNNKVANNGVAKNANENYCNGLTTSNATFKVYDASFCDGKNIIEMCMADGHENTLFLCDDGTVYGYGREKMMGLSHSNKIYNKEMMMKLENIVQVVGGKEWFVAIDKEGKVYGIGNNSKGILGRWKGAPRSAGRYRTAFEWVECPELEI